ncbi:hypothetical protein PENPOL_c048G06091 [Penicillium polonicum]|uniref:Uncharacterized protein n=1 Tax=Penicillium polonicum TaxID=60169 RepID=A0A1V6N5G3_PENPO|nr:hypothetical protein PENPOL_c048G06091 [Penicillium polonicum]
MLQGWTVRTRAEDEEISRNDPWGPRRYRQWEVLGEEFRRAALQSAWNLAGYEEEFDEEADAMISNYTLNTLLLLQQQSSPSKPHPQSHSDLGEGRSLPLVIAGEGVELAAPQSTIASGTPQTLRGAPLDAPPGTPAMAGGVTSAHTTSSVAGIKRELEPTSSVPPSSVGTPSTPADDGPAAKKIKVEPDAKPDPDAKIEPEVKRPRNLIRIRMNLKMYNEIIKKKANTSTGTKYDN